LGRPKKQVITPPILPLVETEIIVPKDNDYFIDKANFARSKLQPFWASSASIAVKQFTVEEVSKLLQNPVGNFKTLQNVSNYILNINRVYDNILEYFTNLLTFDFVLYPITSNDVQQTTLKTRVIASAKIINKIQPQNVFPHILKTALINGESFWYDLSDSQNTIIVEIPKNICVLSSIDEDGLWRYWVDMTLIMPMTLLEYPEEIQFAYKDYHNYPKEKKKAKRPPEDEFPNVPYSYYPVSKSGFALFCHMTKRAHDYPYFINMFTDLMMLSDDKSYFNSFVKDDAVKTIHQEVPLDKDSGKPLMDRDTIQAYHNSTKENIGSSTSVITTPFKTTGISLDKNQQNSINIVKSDSENVMSDSGISSTIFNSDSTNGLGYSTEKDAAKMYQLLYFFQNYINYKIKSLKCQVSFLHINIFNKKDKHEQYRTDLLSGGSRSLFVSTTDIDLYTYLNLLEMEDLLGFDDMLVPKMNGSQMAVGDLATNGRPPVDPKKASDSTNIVNDSKGKTK